MPPETTPAPASIPPTTAAKPLPIAGAFTDKTAPLEIVSKIEYTPEQAVAFLASIDPSGSAKSSGKGVRVFSAHVGPKGELSFTLYYKA